MQKFKIITYGCQMNENDSEKIAGMLIASGFSQETELKDCDLIVMNTCSVRENADDRFFGNLGELKALKKDNPSLVVAVCGCMMQQAHIVDKINRKYPFVDIIFGTHNIARFPELLRRYELHKERVQEILEGGDAVSADEDLPVSRLYSHKAFISIAYGCDNFCSYCIVPYTRGRERSRKPENIIKEAKAAIDGGCKEIMLLGQNVNSYGKGLDEPCTFAKLLEQCAQLDGLERIRFMTSHPKDFTDDIIDVMAQHENICNSIHLPVQSGSDAVLKQMNRHYTREYYLELVEKIRSRLPEVTVTTDIIVGFPSETEADFEQTLSMMEKCRFDAAFTFIYSPREGTRAAKMPQINSSDVLKTRFDRLLELQHKIMHENCLKYAGKTVNVLTDGTSKNDRDMFTGRTKNNMLVNFSGHCRTGETVNVKITRPATFYLLGEQVEK